MKYTSVEEGGGIGGSGPKFKILCNFENTFKTKFVFSLVALLSEIFYNFFYSGPVGGGGGSFELII